MRASVLMVLITLSWLVFVSPILSSNRHQVLIGQDSETDGDAELDNEMDDRFTSDVSVDNEVSFHTLMDAYNLEAAATELVHSFGVDSSIANENDALKSTPHTTSVAAARSMPHQAPPLSNKKSSAQKSKTPPPLKKSAASQSTPPPMKNSKNAAAATKTPRAILRNTTYKNIDEEFSHHVAVFGKKYANNPKLMAQKKAVYIASRNQVEQHNKAFAAGKVSFTRRLTEHADKSEADMMKLKQNPELVAKLLAAARKQFKPSQDTTRRATTSHRFTAISIASPKGRPPNSPVLPSFGGANSGGANSGGANNGGANNGGANNGGANNGGANNGGANNGGAKNGGVGGYGPRPEDKFSFPHKDTLNFASISKYANAAKVTNQGKDGTCWAYAVASAVQYHNLIKAVHPKELLNEVIKSEAQYDTEAADRTLKNSATKKLTDQLEDRKLTLCGKGHNLLPSVLKNFTTTFSALAKAEKRTVEAVDTKSSKRGGYAIRALEQSSEEKLINPPNTHYELGKISSSLRYSGAFHQGVKSIQEFKDQLQQFGPAVINIDARNMSTYSNGVFNGTPTKADGSLPTGDHFVVATGFGVDTKTKQEYIIIQNSWGSNWGDKGFARISMNSFDLQTALFIKPPPAAVAAKSAKEETKPKPPVICNPQYCQC